MAVLRAIWATVARVDDIMMALAEFITPLRKGAATANTWDHTCSCARPLPGNQLAYLTLIAVIYRREETGNLPHL